MFLLDTTITQFVFQLIPHNLFFNYFFSFFSLQGNSFFIWILIIAIIIIIEEIHQPGTQKTDINFIFYFLISFIAASSLVNFVLKPIFHRPRPPLGVWKLEIGNWKLNNRCPNDYSFPSSHAATAFAAACVIAAFDKKRRWFYWGVAFLISLSRIYLGCHYFFDVLAGAVLGYLISIILLRFVHETFPSRRRS